VRDGELDALTLEAQTTGPVPVTMRARGGAHESGVHRSASRPTHSKLSSPRFLPAH